MPYINPETVVSPKHSWTLTKVILNTGRGGWSAAEGEWCKKSCLATRWNGSDNDSGIGNPQSRGHPTWFIVPEELEPAIRREIELLSSAANVVTCTIVKPENYDIGAWRVTAQIDPVITDKAGDFQLSFSLPALEKGVFHTDKEYLKHEDSELRGCFIDGKWEGDLYSKALSEADSNITIDDIKDTLIHNVTFALQQADLIEE